MKGEMIRKCNWQRSWRSGSSLGVATSYKAGLHHPSLCLLWCPPPTIHREGKEAAGKGQKKHWITLRPVSSQTPRRIHINDRPMSAPWRLRKSSSLQRLPPLINSIESDNPDVFNSSRQLFSPRVIAENSILEPLPKPATYASPKSPRSSIAKHTSRVKVIGLTDTPLVVDLLSFDTIRTLYRVIQSMLPEAK